PMLYPAELWPRIAVAEREGFEPSIELLALYPLSKRAPSASRPSLPLARRRSLHVPLFDFQPAEEEGFEPPDAFTSAVFKTAAFDRSATPPDERDAVMPVGYCLSRVSTARGPRVICFRAP